MFLFTVKQDGREPYEVEATSRDIVQWEKVTREKTMKTLMEEMSMVDLYKVAWFAARRLGKFHGTYEEWESLVDLDLAGDNEEEDGLDPTRSAPSPEPVLSLPALPASPQASGSKKASKR